MMWLATLRSAFLEMAMASGVQQGVEPLQKHVQLKIFHFASFQLSLLKSFAISASRR
jgi:hypothetical protein